LAQVDPFGFWTKSAQLCFAQVSSAFQSHQCYHQCYHWPASVSSGSIHHQSLPLAFVYQPPSTACFLAFAAIVIEKKKKSLVRFTKLKLSKFSTLSLRGMLEYILNIFTLMIYVS
jgi:hypothetical protein